MMGGTGAADAATELFLRSLAQEAGGQGVRVVSIYTAAVVEALTREKLTDVSSEAPDPAEVEQMIAGMAMLGRAPGWRRSQRRRRSWPRIAPPG